jgi:hypothetical protein
MAGNGGTIDNPIDAIRYHSNAISVSRRDLNLAFDFVNKMFGKCSRRVNGFWKPRWRADR